MSPNKRGESILSKFSETAVRRANSLWFPPKTAISVIREAKAQGVPILGFDGARIDGDRVTPSLADSWDYGSRAFPPVMDGYKHAIRFIQERLNGNLYFEIVLSDSEIPHMTHNPNRRGSKDAPVIMESARAAAIPPPMPAHELEAASDLIARVRVVEVERAGTVHEYGEELAVYCASLRILAVRKGAAKPGDTVQVTWRDVPRGLPGPWMLAYSVGEEVVTHLKWDAATGRYVSTWWNAKVEHEDKGGRVARLLRPLLHWRARRW